MNYFKIWKESHPNLYEFINLHILSNCATITNFVVMWMCTGFVFRQYREIPFHFFIFDYTEPESLQLCGFYSFLTATAAAQNVNFFVLKYLVFHSNEEFGRAAWKYLILAIILVMISTALPAYSQGWFTAIGVPDTLAPTLAKVLNFIVQVIISYPMMKFWIMPVREKQN